MKKPYSITCDFVFAKPNEDKLHFVTADNKRIKTNCGKLYSEEMNKFVRRFNNQYSIDYDVLCDECKYSVVHTLDQ